MNVALRPLDLLSICTGGGGLDLAVELAIPGARSVCMVEREAFAIATLVEAMRTGLLAQAPVWSDARTFDGRAWRGCVDGLIGGIPCQPHSLAGKRRGELDERDLWSAARRIIVQARPWFVLIENVPGMLTAKPGLDPGAARVRRDLYRLGFRVAGGLFRASDVGAPHERERLFILGVADAGCAGRQQVTGSASGDEGSHAGWPAQHDHVSERGGEGMADAEDLVNPESGARRIYSRSRPEGRGTSDARRPSADVVHPLGRGRDGRAGQPQRGPQGRAAAERAGEVALFPPGPADLDAWREVLRDRPEFEPAVRGMADGLAGRVDRLRMLGNGVHPLEGAYAIRTLAADLAARGSAGAALLVRHMTDIAA